MIEALRVLIVFIALALSACDEAQEAPPPSAGGQVILRDTQGGVTSDRVQTPNLTVSHPIQEVPTLYGDGINDDTRALQAMANGLPYRCGPNYQANLWVRGMVTFDSTTRTPTKGECPPGKIVTPP